MDRDLLLGIKLLFAALVLFALSFLKPIQSFLSLGDGFFAALARPAFVMRQTYLDGTKFLVDLPQVLKHISALEEENASLRSNLLNFKELEVENKALKEQLKIFPSLADGTFLVEAKVLAEFVYQSGEHYFLINKGVLDGIKEDEAVLYKDELLGVVSEVGVKTTRVQSILDKGFNLPCSDATAKESISGTCRADFGNGLLFENLPPGKEVKEGDLIVTSGKDGRFGAKYILGQVATVKGELYDLGRSAFVAPFSDSLPEVVFVVGN